MDDYPEQVYEAEDSLMAKLNLHRKLHLKTVDDIQDFINSVIDTGWWKSRTSIKKVTAIRGKDTSRQAYIKRGPWSYYYGRIYRGSLVVIPFSWANNKIIVLHELAHLMTHIDKPHHGYDFIRNYHKLIDRFIEIENIGDLLKEEIRNLGIVVT